MKSHVTGRVIRRAAGTAAIWGLLLAVASGCGEKIPERYRPFFDLPTDKQRDSLLRYPIAEQLEVYSIGMRVIRPPPMYLARFIATNGPTAIPAILARLRTVEDDYDRSDLILILERMVCLEGVDLRKEPQTIDAIREAIAGMPPDQARDVAETELATITDGCVTKSLRARERFDRLRHLDSSRQ